MASRHKAREQALQILYQIDLLKAGSSKSRDAKSELSTEQAVRRFKDNFEHSPEDLEFVAVLVSGVKNEIANIDTHIESCSHNWKMSRMGPIERNILRLATYELLFCKEVPTPVVLNEAIEIAKKFGNDESQQFINGILDTLAEKIQR